MEIVLNEAKTPLSAEEIVHELVKRGLVEFPDETPPEKIIHARLSTDIKHNKSTRFKWVAPAQYTLHDFFPEQESKTSERTIRYSDKWHDRTLVFKADVLDQIGYFHGIRKDYSLYRDALLTPTAENSCESEYSYFMRRDKAEKDVTHKQVVCYVLIKYKDQLMRYQRSEHWTSLRENRGKYSIGFGGHIEQRDCDMFNNEYLGLERGVQREILEEIGIDIFSNPDLKLVPLGVLNDDSVPQGKQHFAFLFLVELTDREHEKAKKWIKAEKWIKKPELVPISKFSEGFEEYEYWSQLCIQSFFKESLNLSCCIAIKQDLLTIQKYTDIVLVTGFIGSGKTEACTLLEREFGYKMTRCSRLMQQVIGCGSIEEIGRRGLQEEGFKFIHGEDGHNHLTQAIIRYMQEYGVGERYVLDGLRYPETYEMLMKMLGRKVVLFYIDAPLENLYRNYQDRGSSDNSLLDFLNVIHHPVEREIQRFRPMADVVVYNLGSIDSYLEKLRKFLTKLGVKP